MVNGSLQYLNGSTLAIIRRSETKLSQPMRLFSLIWVIFSWTSGAQLFGRSLTSEFDGLYCPLISFDRYRFACTTAPDQGMAHRSLRQKDQVDRSRSPNGRHTITFGYGRIWKDNGEERGSASLTVHGSAEGRGINFGWQYLPGLDAAFDLLVGAFIATQWTEGSFYHSYRFQGVGVSLTGDQRLRSTALQMPVLASFRVHRRLRVNAGATVQVLLRSEHSEAGMITRTYHDHVETSEVSGSFSYGEPHGASTTVGVTLGSTFWLSRAVYLDLRGNWSPGHKEESAGYNPCNTTLMQFSLGLDPWWIWSRTKRPAQQGVK